MAFNLVDEDEDLQFAKTPTPAFNKPNGKSTGKAASAAASTNSTTVKWGDSSIQTGDGLDRLKATTERQLRFALIPGVDPAAGKTHYVAAGTRKGMFVCPGNGCPICPREDARHNIVALVVSYTNADANGKLPADQKPQYKVGYISLSPSHFRTLSEATEGATPYDCDWIQSSDSKRYTFRAVSTTPRYVKAEDADTVKKLAAPFVGRLNGKVGRTISAVDLKAMLAGSPTVELEDDGE